MYEYAGGNRYVGEFMNNLYEGFGVFSWVSKAAWRGVAWRGGLLRRVAWWGVASRGAAWYGVAWGGVAWRRVASRGVAWRGMVWHDRHTTPHRTAHSLTSLPL